MRDSVRAYTLTWPNLAYQLRKAERTMSMQFATHRKRFAAIERLDGFEGCTKVGTPFSQVRVAADTMTICTGGVGAMGNELQDADGMEVDSSVSRSVSLVEALAADDDVDDGGIEDEEQTTLESVEKAFEVISIVD